MFTVLLVIVGIYIAYRLLRSREYDQRPYAPGGYSGTGMGGMLGGMILGYLLTHYLIDQNQYDMWRNLDAEQLRATLISQGILNDSDYERLAGQASSGMLPGYENNNDTDTAGWTNANSDYSETTDYDSYDVGGDGGDSFGGFDS